MVGLKLIALFFPASLNVANVGVLNIWLIINHQPVSDVDEEEYDEDAAPGDNEEDEGEEDEEENEEEEEEEDLSGEVG